MNKWVQVGVFEADADNTCRHHNQLLGSVFDDPTWGVDSAETSAVLQVGWIMCCSEQTQNTRCLAGEDCGGQVMNQCGTACPNICGLNPLGRRLQGGDAPTCSSMQRGMVLRCIFGAPTDHLDTSEIGQSPCEQCGGALSLYSTIVADCVLSIRSNQDTIQPHSLPEEADGRVAVDYMSELVTNCNQPTPAPAPGPCVVGTDDPDGEILAATGLSCSQLQGLVSMMVAPLPACEADLNQVAQTDFPTSLLLKSVCMETCGECVTTAVTTTNAEVTVVINTLEWANEISWNIDGGTTFGPYADNSVNEEVLSLSPGQHTLNYFDSYGDGWHGGYWTLINPADGTMLAGGPAAGLVTGAGGATSFVLGSDGTETLASGAQLTITVHIHTLDWANEITWSVDGGQMFGVDPAFLDNTDYYEEVTLPEGQHTLSYFDTYGDGWHGGYWEILPGAVDAGSYGAEITPIAGGPVDGLVVGSGGETSFVLGADAALDSVVMNAQVNVQVTTITWADEITWNVDGGTTFGPYADNSVNDQVLDLSVGEHTLNYFDSYGDGWHGGYWTLINPADGTMLAGGPAAGLVTGAGGATSFVLGSDGTETLASGAQLTITVHIHTLDWANEITWSVDGGQIFGVTPPFEDNNDYYEALTLPEGQHTMNFIDTYGDGWHGGYWEILPGAVDAGSAAGLSPLAGGPTAGLVEGSGGETSFVLGSGGGQQASNACTTQCVIGYQCSPDAWWDDENGLCVPQDDCP